MEYKFNLNGKVHKVKIEQDKDFYLVNIDDKEQLKVGARHSVSLQNCLSLIIDGKVTTVYVAFDEEKRYVFADGNYFTLELEKRRAEKTRDIGTGKRKNSCSSPMPGTVVKILVSLRDKVEIGQTLAIVEAMKMENELKSPIKGRVKQINFSEGEQVDALLPVVELETL